MRVSQVNSPIFGKQKYQQPTIKEQMPSMAGGFALGSVVGAIYCKRKHFTGKKLFLGTVSAGAGFAFYANILYLLTHLPKKIEENKLNKTPNKNSSNNKNTTNQKGGNVSFKGIFDLIHVPGESLKRKAEVSVNRYASSAATTAATLANTGFGDSVALAIITKNMCKKIFEIYDCSGGPTTGIGAVFAGKNLGINLLTKAATIVPGAGNALNATITYTLHQLEGRALIEILENFKDDLPDMSELDLISNINDNVSAGINGIQNDTVRKILKGALDFFV